MSSPAVSVDVKRHYSAGPRHAYCYTYAGPASVGPRPPFVLEVWQPKGRKGGQWIPFVDKGTGAVPRHKTWRKVRRWHQHADKLAHSIGAVKSCGHTMSAEAQCDAYLAWALAKGLATVSVYAPREATGKGWYGAKCAKALGFQVRAVDPADIHGDAPAPELETAAA